MAVERLANLDSVPDLGAWFDSLRQQMGAGDPPLLRFEKGAPLMQCGELADRFLVVLRGTAAVLGAGDEEPPIEVGPGALLGELGVLHGGKRRRTIVATSPVVAVAGTRRELERALQDEAIGAHVASVAARRLAERVQPLPATTRRGVRVLLRPLLPSDRASYLAALGSVSRETLRTRFFGGATPPDEVIERLIDIDYVDHVAWVAIAPSGAEPLGVCRLITNADDPKSAELAIGIIDPHQGEGLGTLLVGTLGVVAEARGMTTITASVLRENRAMRAVLDKAGASWTRSDLGIVATRLPAGDVAALLDPETAKRVTAATRELEQAARLADA